MNDYHYAVVVGINRYPGISDLAGPINDATAFRTWAVDPKGGGLLPANARLVAATPAGVALPDPDDVEPKRWRIDRALEMITTKARGDIGADFDRWNSSRLYLFFAGHGIAPAGTDSALLTADARRGINGRNVDIRLHVDWLRRCGEFRELVVFADCCRNRVNNASPAGPVFDACASARGPMVHVVGYSAALGDLAYEDIAVGLSPDETRGYFSAALMQALNGDSGAADEHGNVTAASLSGWLRRRVEVMTEHKPVPQSVEMPVPNDPIVFRQGVTRPRYAVTIRFPAAAAPTVRLIDHARKLVDTWDPGRGPWSIMLADGTYQVVLDDTGDGSMFANDGLFQVRGQERNVQL